MKYPDYMETDIDYPCFFRVEQDFSRRGLENPVAVLEKSLDQTLFASGIRAGERVAILAGSRGIRDIALLVRTVCRKIRNTGAEPVIVPAMGSHGGATADGQKMLLESLGLRQEDTGAEILSSMDVVRAGTIPDGVPVFFSKDAAQADHIICINRIKPHTKFKGPVESGLYKMLCVGAGKHRGAEICHQAALRHGFFSVIKAAGDLILETMNFCFGIGIVEDAFGDPMHIEAIPAADLFARERELLKIAKENTAKLPVRELDALIIRQIGKEISGSGMDPNVTGRAYDLMEDDFSLNMNAVRVALLDLTDKTDGNGIGLGNADIITEKLFRKLDYEKTLTNALTSLSLRKAFIPVRMKDDRMAIRAAFTTAGLRDIRKVRAVIIENTKNLTEFFAGEALLEELNSHPDLTVKEKVSLEFDDSGDLILY